jgi:hypothetical protein
MTFRVYPRDVCDAKRKEVIDSFHATIDRLRKHVTPRSPRAAPHAALDALAQAADEAHGNEAESDWT